MQTGPSEIASERLRAARAVRWTVVVWYQSMSFALFIVYILCTYLRPFEMFAPQLNEYRPMLILLALALITATVRATVRQETGARAIHFKLLMLLVLAIGVSQVANQWAGGALVSIGDFSASAMLMVLCFLNLTSIERLRATCIAIITSAVLLAGIGILSFHTGFKAEELVLRQNPTDEDALESVVVEDMNAIPALDTSGRYFLRLRSLGFLNDPNDFAQFMVMVLPLLWWAHAPGRWVRNLLILGVPGAMLGYAIYLTQSRGALLGIGALLLLVAHRWLGTIRTALLAGLAVVALGAISFGGRELSTQEDSAAQRIDAWYAGWNMLKAKPLFGVGYGNFLDHHYLTAHNSFVLCFSELGLFGYFAWLGLIVLTFVGLNRALKLAPLDAPERRLTELLRASLVAYLACAWFLSRTYQPGLYVVLALCIAAWVCTQKLAAPTAPQVLKEVLPWPKVTLMAMVASIATVYVFIAVQSVTG
jgi:putative inorganic carbon (hco3(-)) transporter